MDVAGPDFGFATYAVHEEEIAARRRGATEADDIKLAPVSLLDRSRIRRRPTSLAPFASPVGSPFESPVSFWVPFGVPFLPSSPVTAARELRHRRSEVLANPAFGCFG